jgi:hypothetical protein
MRGSSPPVYGPFGLSVAETIYLGLNGVYAVFARIGSRSFPIDVGESEDIGTRLRAHDRKRDWFSLLRQGLPVTFEVYATPTRHPSSSRSRRAIDSGSSGSGDGSIRRRVIVSSETDRSLKTTGAEGT